MTINPHLIKHIDSKSLELVELVETEVPEKTPTPTYRGSIEHKNALDLSGKIDLSVPVVSSQTSYNGSLIDKWLIKDNIKVGYSEKNYSKFSEIVKSFYKSPEISQAVTLSFFKDLIFKWCIEVFNSASAFRNLSEHIINEITESITTQTYCFPLLNLEIEAPVKIGDVKIKYFTKEDFDYLTDNFNPPNSSEQENPYPTLRKEFEGLVVASCTITGQPDRAEKLALTRCLLAVDILKVCSNTLIIPDLALNFDIDMRAREQLESKCIKHGPKKVDSFILSMQRLPKHQVYNSRFHELVISRNIYKITNFAFAPSTKSELRELVLYAIANFADALSNKDLNKRVVELFSIYESLLLPNDNSPIQDSLNKYGTKLIFQEPNDRNDLKKLFTEMYAVRSAMVHHGKRKVIEIEKLFQLQISLQALILVLIDKSKTHSTKKSILTDIDDAINSAY